MQRVVQSCHISVRFRSQWCIHRHQLDRDVSGSSANPSSCASTSSSSTLNWSNPVLETVTSRLMRKVASTVFAQIDTEFHCFSHDFLARHTSLGRSVAALTRKFRVHRWSFVMSRQLFRSVSPCSYRVSPRRASRNTVCGRRSQQESCQSDCAPRVGQRRDVFCVFNQLFDDPLDVPQKLTNHVCAWHSYPTFALFCTGHTHTEATTRLNEAGKTAGIWTVR